VLEKLRTTKKEVKQLMQHGSGQIKEGTFILPAFKVIPATSEASVDDSGEEASGAQQLVIQYQNIRKDKGLTYNHYANSGPGYDIELQPQLILEE
jgi:hypothetical protein